MQQRDRGVARLAITGTPRHLQMGFHQMRHGATATAVSVREQPAVQIERHRAVGVARHEFTADPQQYRALPAGRDGDPASGQVEAHVARRADRLVRQIRETGKPACIEAIKLLESPLRDRCDETWVVRCEEADALARLAERGIDEAAARARRRSAPVRSAPFRPYWGETGAAGAPRLMAA